MKNHLTIPENEAIKKNKLKRILFFLFYFNFYSGDNMGPEKDPRQKTNKFNEHSFSAKMKMKKKTALKRGTISYLSPAFLISLILSK